MASRPFDTDQYRLDDVASRVFIKSSALEQVVVIHSGMATERASRLSNQAKSSHWMYTPKMSRPVLSCQVIYSQFGLAIHQNDHQARHRFVEWAQNEIAVVPDFHSDEAHFWVNGYINKQNCRIWSEANPQVYVETPLHPEKLTVWCALWAGGILLQKR
ncbi:hypothetical protein TNCV_18281 [Trichonephila clavipes]|nr:hypothetical protein TNCV_18281 [Trichonephila clavipes]